MNLSHEHEVVQDALSPFGHGIEFVVEHPEPFGSAGTLASLRERFDGPVVTRNADLLSDLSVRDLISTHIREGLLATIATVRVTAGADLVVQGARAIELVDRRTRNIAGHTWLGVSVWERSALDLISEERPLDLTRGLLATLIERGEVAVHSHDGYALDVGTFARYLTASLDLLYRRAPAPPRGLPGQRVEVDNGLAYVGPGASIEGRLHDGAMVLSGAKLGTGAIVRNAIVWPGAVVADGTSVEDGVWAFGRLYRV